MGENCRCTVTLLAVTILERLNEKPILHPMQLNSQGRGIPKNQVTPKLPKCLLFKSSSFKQLLGKKSFQLQNKNIIYFSYCSNKVIKCAQLPALTNFLCLHIESPLDCKEIQPVHSKGDQSWVFFGRNDAEAETPVLWPPHAKSFSFLTVVISHIEQFCHLQVLFAFVFSHI